MRFMVLSTVITLREVQTKIDFIARSIIMVGRLNSVELH